VDGQCYGCCPMTSQTYVHDLHLLGLGGSNKVMAGELSRLTRRALDGERSKELLRTAPRKSGPGGLIYPFAPDLAAVAVSYHRTSARVLWDLHSSEQVRLEPLFDELVEGIAADEREWLVAGARFSVLAFGVDSIEAGERQVVGVVKNALIEGAARRGLTWKVDGESPDFTFHARCHQDAEGKRRLVLSLDLAGRPMHRRGYRTQSGEAPLREDLAANLVMLSRFDARSDVFIDPMAGAGTLAVEAALMAAGKPVWMSGRKVDALGLPSIAAHLNELGKPLFADSAPSIFAGEIDEDVYGLLDRSVDTAGVSSQTTTYCGDFFDWDLKSQIKEQKSGLILSNPPYGARLGGNLQELRRLYQDLGEWCAQFPGFRAGFIVGEPESDSEKREGPSLVHTFQQNFGGRPRVKKPMKNGPLNAYFLLYDL